MNDDRLLELLSGEADGDLSPDEQRELDRLVAADPSARELRDSQRRMDSLLRSMPEVEPPAGLAAAIVGRARLPEGGAARSGPHSVIPRWLRPPAIGGYLRYGLSAAFGALLTIAVYDSLPDHSRPANITELVGTIAPDSELAGRHVIDNLALQAGDVTSFARLESRDGALVLDIRIDTARPLEISIHLGAAGLGLEALAQPPNGLDSIQLQDKVLRIVGSGQSRFAVLLHESHAETPAGKAGLMLEFSSDGKLLKQGSLKLTQQRRDIQQ